MFGFIFLFRISNISLQNINNYDDDIVLVKEVQSTAYGKQDWKKLKTELENLGVIVKKCKKGNAQLRDKMCCFGISKKLIPESEIV